MTPVTCWDDPRRDGYDPCGPYLEHAWLPILGPTAAWLYRWLQGADHLDEHVAAAALGVRLPVLRRALERLETFGLLRRDYSGGLSVRSTLPPLTAHQLDRLPPAIAAAVRDHERTLT